MKYIFLYEATKMENIIFINSYFTVYPLWLTVNCIGMGVKEKEEKIIYENLLLEFNSIFIILYLSLIFSKEKLN